MPGPQNPSKKPNIPPELLHHRYLNESEVTALTGRGLQSLRNDRCRRRGIRYCKVGKRVLYRLSDVLEFMDAHLIQTEAM